MASTPALSSRIVQLWQDTPMWVKVVVGAGAAAAIALSFKTKAKTTPEQGKKFIKAVWSFFDKDHNSSLSVEELGNQKLFQQMDIRGAFMGSGLVKLKAGDGKVTYDEFFLYWVATAKTEGWDAVRVKLIALIEEAKKQQVKEKQQVLGVKQHTVTEEQRKQLLDAFVCLDDNGDGYLILDEFTGGDDIWKTVFAQMDTRGRKIGTATVKFDVGDGCVSREEWLAHWESAVGEHGWDDIKGVIVKRMQQNAKKDKLKEKWLAQSVNLFQIVDKDGNGEVSKREMEEWVDVNPEEAVLLLPGLLTKDPWKSVFNWLQVDDTSGSLTATEFSGMYLAAMTKHVWSVGVSL